LFFPEDHIGLAYTAFDFHPVRSGSGGTAEVRNAFAVNGNAADSSRQTMPMAFLSPFHRQSTHTATTMSSWQSLSTYSLVMPTKRCVPMYAA
ncbi:MAG: hypothetical protein II204_02205, partial [Alistipes sp.]|nr:hypothetical protein [Alistipes sp.]